MLYLDSADLEAITPLAQLGVFRGVTTNPTILKQAGRGFNDIETLDQAFCDLGLTERFYQAVGSTMDDLLASAERILNLGDQVWVKIPAVGEGLRAAAHLSGQPILLTAIYHPTQALLAQHLGVDWIAPYVGRMDDLAGNGVAQTAIMARTLAGSTTRVLAASLRTPAVLGDLMAVGVSDFTVSPAIAHQVVNEPHAVHAWEVFEQDDAQTRVTSNPQRKDV